MGWHIWKFDQQRPQKVFTNDHCVKYYYFWNINKSLKKKKLTNETKFSSLDVICKVRVYVHELDWQQHFIDHNDAQKRVIMHLSLACSCKKQGTGKSWTSISVTNLVRDLHSASLHLIECQSNDIKFAKSSKLGISLLCYQYNAQNFDSRLGDLEEI